MSNLASRRKIIMTWQQLCEHSSLKDLPFRIELNEIENIRARAGFSEEDRNLNQDARMITD